MIASLAILVAATLQPAAYGTECTRVTVHDGDTIRCDGERVRLLDIDAPEMEGSPRCRKPRPRDWCDYKLAIRSRDALRAFVRTGKVRIVRRGQDVYGRTLAHVTVNGRDAGQYLRSLGLARPYR